MLRTRMLLLLLLLLLALHQCDVKMDKLVSCVLVFLRHVLTPWSFE
jgi:hypothetical protein